MSAVTVTSAQVRALTEFGADVVPGKAGATVTIGYLVTQESDGDWVHADADAVGSQSVLGVAVESFDGEDTVAEGNAVSVCISGPVSGFSSLTPAALYYVSNTIGRLDTAEGSYDRIVGNGMYIAGETVLNVNVQLTDAASD
jgi:hypothetical protein